MTQNYGKLEKTMSDLYQYVQDNPNAERERDLLMQLSTVGLDMISLQMDFTQSYGDPKSRDSLTEKLDSKAQALASAKNQVLAGAKEK